MSMGEMVGFFPCVDPLLILKDGSMGERLATIMAVVRLFFGVFLLMGLKVMWLGE